MSADVREWSRCIFVDGKFRPPAGATTLEVLDKASGEVLGVSGLAGAADVDTALVGAQTAQQEWSRASYAERASLLRRAAEVLQKSSGAFSEMIVRETGSIAGKADYEVGAATAELFEAASLAGRPFGELLRSDHGGRLSIAERVPVGVVGTITPWNFPLVLAMRVIAPALALGNAVVLKPSPETPLCGGLMLAEVFSAAGAPPGLFQVLPGVEDVGHRIVEHPAIDMVHFTGSTKVGRQIAATAGGLLKKVSLELGGNNALIVFDDVDADEAAMVGAWSSFHYQGQTCITAGRHIVLRGIAEQYVERLAARAAGIVVGDPFREQVGLGPMINERQLQRARSMLDEATEDGARIVVGGTSSGLFFSPTVVTAIDPKMRLWRDEIFAPIAPVLVVDSEEEAIAVCNDTEYGLVNSVLSRDEARAVRVARALRSGMVHVNDATPQDEAVAPFGGVRSSGLGGRSGGDSNLEEFTERRWLTVAASATHYPY